jgi:hypothetical protein
MSKSLEIEKGFEGSQVVFRQQGTDLQAARKYKTRVAYAIYGNRTHSVTNQALTIEMLKEISDSKDVLEVTGEYTADKAASSQYTPKRLIQR